MSQTIDVEAVSLEEARNQMMLQAPEGLQVLSETILSDGQPKFVGGYGVTMDAAFASAEKDLPPAAFDVERKEVSFPEQTSISVEANDEHSARYEVERDLPKWRAEIKSLTLAAAGRKGFLGIGKKPNRYEAEVFRPAYAEISYKLKAKISATFGYANRGMRQDSMGQATAYWMARMSSVKKDPFVMYTFDKAEDARAALVELPCVHDEDGQLVCTETLIFGHYQRDDGVTEAIVCGDDLTRELWAKAIESFKKHGGKRKNDLEPEERSASPSALSPSEGDAASVEFVTEERKQSALGGTAIYRIYRGPDASSAKAFLDKNPVTQPLHYIIVETPEGNYGRDIEGFYKE